MRKQQSLKFLMAASFEEIGRHESFQSTRSTNLYWVRVVIYPNILITTQVPEISSNATTDIKHFAPTYAPDVPFIGISRTQQFFQQATLYSNQALGIREGVRCVYFSIIVWIWLGNISVFAPEPHKS